MTVSGYFTNQSVFTVPLLQLCEIRFFFMCTCILLETTHVH